jgi:hypothetical protein
LWSLGGDGHFRSQNVHTFHAEPGPGRDSLETDAVGMVRGITAIAEKENLLLVCSVAHRAWCCVFFLLGILVDPGLGIELCDLFLVFDFVGREQAA